MEWGRRAGPPMEPCVVRHLRALVVGWLVGAMALLPMQAPSLAMSATMSASECCVVVCGSTAAAALECGGCGVAEEPPAPATSTKPHEHGSAPAPCDEESLPPCCRACCPAGLVAVLDLAPIDGADPVAGVWTMGVSARVSRALEPAAPPPKAR